MAEGADGNGGATAQLGGISLTNELIFGQSKSGSSDFTQFKQLEVTESDKNQLYLVCRHCNCRIMGPGYGTLVKKEVTFNLVNGLVTSSFNLEELIYKGRLDFPINRHSFPVDEPF